MLEHTRRICLKVLMRYCNIVPQALIVDKLFFFSQNFQCTVITLVFKYGHLAITNFHISQHFSFEKFQKLYVISTSISSRKIFAYNSVFWLLKRC